MGNPALYTKIHQEQWNRIKSLDFPEGPVAIMDHDGKALIHRPHSRRVLRQMARDASRRLIRDGK